MARVATDLFAKTRDHERAELLDAAREHDLVPYFRLTEGEAGPLVEMEGAERVMLGSNNYLGLTRDPRVKQAAADALATYGPALPGSRLLTGTLPMPLELEAKLAAWRAPDAALANPTATRRTSAR